MYSAQEHSIVFLIVLALGAVMMLAIFLHYEESHVKVTEWEDVHTVYQEQPLKVPKLIVYKGVPYLCENLKDKGFLKEE